MIAKSAKKDQLFHNKPPIMITAKTTADKALTLKTEKLNAMIIYNFIQDTTMRLMCLIQWF